MTRFSCEMKTVVSPYIYGAVILYIHVRPRSTEMCKHSIHCDSFILWLHHLVVIQEGYMAEKVWERVSVIGKTPEVLKMRSALLVRTDVYLILII